MSTYLYFVLGQWEAHQEGQGHIKTKYRIFCKTEEIQIEISIIGPRTTDQ